MESAKTYIICKLKQLITAMPQLCAFYQFDALSKEHLLKILPTSEFTNNEQYLEAEEKLLFDFIELYPFDSLVFLSEGDWIDIDQPEHVFVGDEYQLNNFRELIKQNTTVFNENEFFKFNSIDEDIVNLPKEVLDFFSAFKPEFSEQFVVNNLICDEFYGEIDLNKILACNESNVEKKNSEPNNNATEPSCQNFALAA